MGLLQEDTLGTTKAILMTISLQLANRTTEAYQDPPFVVPTYAIRVNALFFSSISCSLVTALASIIVLQWIGNYEANLTRSSTPKDRAVRRYFRWKGVKKWKLSKTISAIVHLLYLALFLFFAGSVDWLWQINVTVAIVTLVGYSFGVIFWLGTTLILSLDPSAPYRTSLSKALILPTKQDIREWFRAVVAIVFSDDEIPYESLTFHQREDQLIRHNAILDHSTTMWLLKSLDTTMVNNKSYIVALQYLLTLPAETLASKATDDAPWVSIYSLLLVEYYDFGTTPASPTTFAPPATEERESKIKFLLITLAVIGNWTADSFIISFLEKAAGESGELRDLADIALWKHSPQRGSSSFGRALCRRLASSRDNLPDIVLHSMVIGLRWDVRLLRKVVGVLSATLHEYLSILTRICLYPMESSSKVPIHPDILETIMCIVLEEGPTRAPPTLKVSASDYILHTSRHSYDTLPDLASLHTAVQMQIICQLSRVSTSDDALESLDPVWQIVKSPEWTRNQDISILSLVEELARLYNLGILDTDPTKPEEGVPWVLKIVSVALPNRYFPRRRDTWFNQEQASALLVKSILQGFDQLQQGHDWHPTSISDTDAKYTITRFIVECLAPYSLEERAEWTDADRTELKALNDPILYLMASVLTGFEWDRKTPQPDNPIWMDPSWTIAIEYCKGKSEWIRHTRNRELLDALPKTPYKSS